MQPILRSRLLPRISFRSLLGATVLAAAIAAMARAAGNGVVALRAVLAGLAILISFMMLSILAFLVSWMIARLIHGRASDALQGNPFAKDNLPPQQIKPRDPSLG
ncbi:MAG: hypothetical protein AAF670_16630 [Planctomycetota bacterium]